MTLTAALLLATPLGAATTTQANSPLVDADTAAIRTVIEAFRTGITGRDKIALDRLPATATITFLASVEAKTLARNRLKRPSIKRLVPGSYGEFVGFVTTATVPIEEKFSNVVIHTDGSAATVWFDYTFEENHKLTNWGHESWAMVHADSGWKIASIVYSISLPEAPDP